MLTGGNIHIADVLLAVLYGGGTGGGIIGGMQFCKWLLGFRASRLDTQQKHVDDSMSALMAHMNDEINRLKEDRVKDRADLNEMREQLKECERQHAEARAEVMELRAMMQGYGNIRNETQKLIAAEKIGDKM